MTSLEQYRFRILGSSLRAVAIGLAIMVILAAVAMPAAQAQTFNVIHTFTGGKDGGGPETGLTFDKAGSLYGTTFNGGAAGGGTVYKLKQSGGNWVFTPLYSFAGGSDGCQSDGRVVFGADGSLYGTTVYGGLAAAAEMGMARSTT